MSSDWAEEFLIDAPRGLQILKSQNDKLIVLDPIYPGHLDKMKVHFIYTPPLGAPNPAPIIAPVIVAQ